MREGLVFVEALGIQNLIVECDCLDLIKACREEIKRGEIICMIKDILYLKEKFCKIGFTWISRHGNSVAHHVAPLASQNALPVNWTRIQPLILQDLIRKEKIHPNQISQGDESVNRSTNSVFNINWFLPSASVSGLNSSAGFPFDPGWRSGSGIGNG